MMIKKAFSLIELVVSMVVIGIVAASFPLILSQTANSSGFAIQQEAVMATKTYVSTILSYPWDENSVMDIVDPSMGRAMILETDNSTRADPAFDRIFGTNLRSGNMNGSGRRNMFNDGYPFAKPNSTVLSGVDAMDIDDFHGKVVNMINVNTTSLDSIISLSSTSSISYVSDSLVSGSYNDTNLVFEFASTGDPIADATATNIKLIEVKTELPNYNLNITLRAYSSNIGEVEINKRDYR